MKNPTTGAFTTNGTAEDAQYFTSDNEGYEVQFIADHLELAVKQAASVFGSTSFWLLLVGVILLLAGVAAAVIVAKKKKTAE